MKLWEIVVATITELIPYSRLSFSESPMFLWDNGGGGDFKMLKFFELLRLGILTH